MVGKSHIFSEMANSVGGIVYLHNRYAAIVGRARVKPVDVNSCVLENQRALFAGAVKSWQVLSDVNHGLWEAYADQTPWTGALGDTIHLTGQAMYVAQMCSYRSWLPSSPVVNWNTPPCTPGLAAAPLLTPGCCTLPEIGIELAVFNPNPYACTACVYISAATRPTQFWHKGPYVPDYTTQLANIPPDVSALMPCHECCEGARVHFMVRLFDDVPPYRMSLPSYCSALCCVEEVAEAASAPPGSKKSKSKLLTGKETPETAVESS